MTSSYLRAEALTAFAFAPYGDIVDAGADRPHRTINAGRAERYDDLAPIDTLREGGRTQVSIFRTRGAALPWRLECLERHVLGSQTFVPLNGARMLIVVAPPGSDPTLAGLRCFVAAAGQGVHYRAGTWHHPLVVLGADADVLVIDRVAERPDCDERSCSDAHAWVVA